MKTTLKIAVAVGAVILVAACATSTDSPVAVAMNSENPGLECNRLSDVSTDLKCEELRFQERYSDMDRYSRQREISFRKENN